MSFNINLLNESTCEVIKIIDSHKPYQRFEKEDLEKIHSLIKDLAQAQWINLNAAERFAKALKKIRFFSREEVRKDSHLSKILSLSFNSLKSPFVAELIEAGAFIDLQAIYSLIANKCHSSLEKICKKFTTQSGFVISQDILKELFKWAIENKKNYYLFPLYQKLDPSEAPFGEELFLQICKTAPKFAQEVIKSKFYIGDIDHLLLIDKAIESRNMDLIVLIAEHLGKSRLVFSEVVRLSADENFVIQIFKNLFHNLEKDVDLTKKTNFAYKFSVELCLFGERKWKGAIEKLLTSFTEEQRKNILNIWDEDQGDTPLAAVCKSKHLDFEIAQFFLQYGADPTIAIGGERKTAIDHAVDSNSKPLLDLLVSSLSEEQKQKFLQDTWNSKNYETYVKLIPYFPYKQEDIQNLLKNFQEFDSKIQKIIFELYMQNPRFLSPEAFHVLNQYIAQQSEFNQLELRNIAIQYGVQGLNFKKKMDLENQTEEFQERKRGKTEKTGEQTIIEKPVYIEFI